MINQLNRGDSLKNLFLTQRDQIIDLNFVIAIECGTFIENNKGFVDYSLSTGKTIRAVHETSEKAIEEKWKAYSILKTLGDKIK